MRLKEFFAPDAVAVVGAGRDPRNLGRAIVRNIVASGYPGPVYPINPHAAEIEQLRAYPSVLDVPGPVELAVVAVPAPVVPTVVEECGRKGVRGLIVISAGFREVGPEGLRREREIVRLAHQYGMRLLGPNCLGVIDTICPINASFAATMPARGAIAVLSQSGALMTAMLDWADLHGVGFSRMVSLGNKADLTEIDFMEAWQDDEASRVIVGYLEGVENGPRFIEVARALARRKPTLVMKSGTTEAGARAASSHTGTLAGSEAAYTAAFRQAGVIRARSVADLLDDATAFASQPLPEANRVAVVTNAGGPGIMATDAAERLGLRLAALDARTISALRQHLPPAASVYNPVDVLGDAQAERYALALRYVLADPNVAAAVCILTPQFMTQIVETAHEIGRLAQLHGKTVVGCFMGGRSMSRGVSVLREYGVPNGDTPEAAMAALAAMVQYQEWLRRPTGRVPRYPLDLQEIRRIVDRARGEGRLTLGDVDALGVLAACGVPIPRQAVASSPEEAARLGATIGFPVVMKVVSPDILHKSDVGGVVVGVRSAEEARETFDRIYRRVREHVPGADLRGVLVQQLVRPGRETIVGMSRDPQFGPLVAFGLGGIYVEVLRDVSFRVAPITDRDAQDMMQEIRTFPLLKGVRGQPPSDLAAVRDVLLRVSQLVVDVPEIVELDVNPLVVWPEGEGAVAVDARMTLAPAAEQARGARREVAAPARAR
ncbi:MAG TPA: acetate--CoA ligase family protein [Chloroflexota bacterium]